MSVRANRLHRGDWVCSRDGWPPPFTTITGSLIVDVDGPVHLADLTILGETAVPTVSVSGVDQQRWPGTRPPEPWLTVAPSAP